MTTFSDLKQGDRIFRIENTFIDDICLYRLVIKEIKDIKGGGKEFVCCNITDTAAKHTTTIVIPEEHLKQNHAVLREEDTDVSNYISADQFDLFNHCLDMNKGYADLLSEYFYSYNK